ncbi:MAG: polyphenol oxidase family protein [Desulfurivibrio sp.]|nr:polyphenol oxidase family protein [Desulfurivibrio sp.]
MDIIAYDHLAAHAVPHGCWNRRGGVSPPPWDSLNVSYGVGDTQERVAANRQRLLAAHDLSSLVAARQVHGREVYVCQQPPASTVLEVAGYDALVTACPGVGLLVQQADCQAVLLFDPRRRVAANIHVGWRGSVVNIIAATIEVLQAEFACRPAELLAAISPSLGPCCAEFVNWQQELPEAFADFRVAANHFDFWAISRYQLQTAGVSVDNIRTAAVCTRCQDAFFSYRRDGQCGRQGTLIAVT